MDLPDLSPPAVGGMSVPAQAATIQITMEDLVFSPAEVSARVGDTIQWINKDVFAHTATARNGDFDVNMPPKKTVTSVLKKAGTIEYYCRFHPQHEGRVRLRRSASRSCIFQRLFLREGRLRPPAPN